jgi:hypothetical protein
MGGTLETIASPEPRQLTLSLALLLFDSYTGRNQLVGLYPSREQELQDVAAAVDDVGLLRAARYTTVRMAGRTLVPRRRESDATFLFFDLQPGSYTVEVRSPYYVAVDVTAAVPQTDPKWPAFPDIALADESLPLDAPAQPAAYRAQRSAATLHASVRYPFPRGTTLVRGVVRGSGQVLAGASVRRQGDPSAALTDAAGEYVLFFTDLAGSGQTVTLEASHPLHTTVTAPVDVVRGFTVVRNFSLP